MIQATELMLGDYVRVEVDDNEFEIDYICDIGYVPEWNDLGVITCHNGNEWLREGEIYPVPLTIEILEKNIFKEDKYGQMVLDEELGTSEIYIVLQEGDACYWWCVGGQPITKLKHVHQLQHVLRLCNIQKEIQL